MTVIEKNQLQGGRLVTHTADGLHMDYGITSFPAKTETFQSYVDELKEKKALREWSANFNHYDGTSILDTHEKVSAPAQYVGVPSMQAVGKNLVRWVDVLSDVKAGGLTYIGPDRRTKRAWMINLTDISVFECDAIIIATPAVQAYGLLTTSQDETPVKRMTRHVEKIRYDRRFTLAVTFDHEAPEWNGIDCDHDAVQLISNESSKQDTTDKTGLVIRSTDAFYREHEEKDDKTIQKLLLKETAGILDSWVQRPQTAYLHRWKYFEAQNPINEYFMELEMEDGPLALVGDYLGGTSVDNAYMSGYNLAEYWINKYSTVSVT